MATYGSSDEVQTVDVVAQIEGQQRDGVKKGGSGGTSRSESKSSRSFMSTATSAALPSSGKTSSPRKVQCISLLVAVLGYLLAFGIFVPLFVAQYDVWLEMKPRIQAPLVITQLEDRIHNNLLLASGRNDTQILDTFADQLVATVVDGVGKNYTTAQIEEELSKQLARIGEVVSPAALAARLTSLAGLLTASGLPPALIRNNLKNTLAKTIATTAGGAEGLVSKVSNGLAVEASKGDSGLPLAAKIRQVEHALGPAMLTALGKSSIPNPEEVYEIMRESYLWGSRETSLTDVFHLGLISSILSIVIILIFAVLVLVFRKSPEIRARHPTFLAQFFGGAVLLPIIGLAQISVVTLQVTLDSEKTRIIFGILGVCAATAAILGLISALILRHRFFMNAYVKQVNGPSYWKYMILWHMFLVAIVLGLFTYCAFGDCTVAERYITVFISVGFLALEMAVYTWHLRSSHDKFVDVWASARAVFVWFVTYVAFQTFACTKNSNVMTAVGAINQVGIVLTGACIDLFLLPLLKAARKGKSSSLNSLDLIGSANAVLGIEGGSQSDDSPSDDNVQSPASPVNGEEGKPAVTV